MQIQITTLDQLKEEQVVGAQVDGVELVAVACGENIRVFEGHCPHQGTLLSEGNIENGRLICRGHGWQFNCASGAKLDDPQICLHQFSIVVDNGKVFVDQLEVADWLAKDEEAEGQEKKRPTLTPQQLPGPRGLPGIGNMHQINVNTIHLTMED